MDKRYSQLELFSEGREPETVKEGVAPSFFFQVNRFEKVIFFLIGFIVTGAGFFCLGVEHGKRLTAQRPTPDFNLALAQKRSAVKIVVTPRAPVTAPQALSPSSRRIEPPSPVVAVPQMASRVRQSAGIPAGSFTIQVGTYQMSDAAVREKDKLASKGFSPVIMKKGAYNIVCVGTFADKETARSLLSKLRQNYRDCYIRRL